MVRISEPVRTDFGKLWTALSISLLGSQITTLALPLFTARSLGASALQLVFSPARARRRSCSSVCRRARSSTAYRAGQC